MSRKIVLVVLTLAAAMTCTACIMSFWLPHYRSFRANPQRLKGETFHDLVQLHIKDGTVEMEAHLQGPCAGWRPGLRLAWEVNLAGLSCAAWCIRRGPLGTSVRQTFRIWRVCCPLWVPFLIFAAYPTVALVRGPLRRCRRRRKGLCVECGYDLTGNVSGVCPECGTEAESG